MVGLHHVQLAMPKGDEVKAIAFYDGLRGLLYDSGLQIGA